jgi:serine phosphatase RsbU (regulator of sigma subunit)
MAHLNLIQGESLEQRFELQLSRSLLGRHPSCQIVVDANSVSRQHAQIIWDGKHFSIEDLKSRNGTFVNSRRIANRTPLNDGDLIKICDFVFRFSDKLLTDEPVTKGASVTRTYRQSSGHFDAEFVDDNAAAGVSSITSRLEVTKRSSSHSRSITAEKKLSTLIEITRALSSALVVEDVLPKVLESLFEMFHQAERGFIFLQDRNGNLIPRWFQTRSSQQTESNLRVSRTILNHVMRSQEAILSTDAALDQRFDMSLSVAGHSVRSILCAPIMDNEKQAIGCIQIDTYSQTAKFNEEDLEVLATVAMQTNIAIENARLMESALQRREVERDLELAHDVQNSILPRSRPKLDQFDFFDFYQPAQQIGGDYYDYVPLANGRIAVLVADVVGHGTSAALLMAKFSSEVRFALAIHQHPAEAVEALNNAICGMGFDRFVTLVVAVIDPVSAEIQFVNAGHNPPLIRRGGQVEDLPLEISGLPIGISSDQKYREFTCSLKPGDLVVMYTDGVTESASVKHEEFSKNRLSDIIAVHEHLRVDKLGAKIIESLNAHVGEASFEDDVCLVCFERWE